MRATTIAVLTTILAVGCGGTDGVRRLRIDPNADAGVDGSFVPLYMCGPPVSVFNCAAPAKLQPNGHVTNFSAAEWDNNGGKWCSNDGGFHGTIYSYKNAAMFPNDVNMQRVEGGSFHIVLEVSAGQYGGGGLAFEGGCLDVSEFSGFKFSAAIVSGGLGSCPLQFQLATFDQRPVTQTPPGGCPMGASCFAYPTVTALPALSDNPASPTSVVLPFTSFSRITTGTLNQIVALQWQVNAGDACKVELLLDDIDFIPAATPEPDASAD
jgi:hypothetical protein